MTISSISINNEKKSFIYLSNENRTCLKSIWNKTRDKSNDIRQAFQLLNSSQNNRRSKENPKEKNERRRKRAKGKEDGLND